MSSASLDSKSGNSITSFENDFNNPYILPNKKTYSGDNLNIPALNSEDSYTINKPILRPQLTTTYKRRADTLSPNSNDFYCNPRMLQNMDQKLNILMSEIKELKLIISDLVRKEK
ncbi:hypothetical protein RF11_05803 [Thelohanellus kitauei]|uniref:Uncharacterized protein n=1 Tax=Thelohanellus kitauei TaxID=669202 RepID=A0A0C2MHE9_THEKT|nr:hypothetical protein RF11_05803 [Thelohanellus kitauei]